MSENDNKLGSGSRAVRNRAQARIDRERPLNQAIDTTRRNYINSGDPEVGRKLRDLQLEAAWEGVEEAVTRAAARNGLPDHERDDLRESLMGTFIGGLDNYLKPNKSAVEIRRDISNLFGANGAGRRVNDVYKARGRANESLDALDEAGNPIGEERGFTDRERRRASDDPADVAEADARVSRFSEQMARWKESARQADRTRYLSAIAALNDLSFKETAAWAIALEARFGARWTAAQVGTFSEQVPGDWKARFDVAQVHSEHEKYKKALNRLRAEEEEEE